MARQGHVGRRTHRLAERATLQAVVGLVHGASFGSGQWSADESHTTFESFEADIMRLISSVNARAPEIRGGLSINPMGR